jgi:hypothetical protein
LRTDGVPSVEVTLHQPFPESLAISVVFSGGLTESFQLFMKDYLLPTCPECDISVKSSNPLAT